jgi:hypothetical protein
MRKVNSVNPSDKQSGSKKVNLIVRVCEARKVPAKYNYNKRKIGQNVKVRNKKF